MKSLYLVLAIVGAIVPYVFFIGHFGDAGFALGSFLGAAFANGAAGGFTADVLLSSLVFWVYLFGRRTPHVWLYVAVNVTIGLSCALPLYLYLASRPGVQTARPAIA